MKNMRSITQNTPNLEKDVRRLSNWMIGVVIVLGLAVVGFLMTLGAVINDSLAEKKATSVDIRNKVNDQNKNIEQLTDKIDDLQEDLKAYEKSSQELNNAMRDFSKAE